MFILHACTSFHRVYDRLRLVIGQWLNNFLTWQSPQLSCLVLVFFLICETNIELLLLLEYLL